MQSKRTFSPAFLCHNLRHASLDAIMDRSRTEKVEAPMTLTIELTPEQESRLAAVARQQGLEPAQLAQRLVTEHLPETAPRAVGTGQRRCRPGWTEIISTSAPRPRSGRRRWMRWLREVRDCPCCPTRPTSARTSTRTGSRCSPIWPTPTWRRAACSRATRSMPSVAPQCAPCAVGAIRSTSRRRWSWSTGRWQHARPRPTSRSGNCPLV